MRRMRGGGGGSAWPPGSAQLRWVLSRTLPRPQVPQGGSGSAVEAREDQERTLMSLPHWAKPPDLSPMAKADTWATAHQA